MSYLHVPICQKFNLPLGICMSPDRDGGTCPICSRLDEDSKCGEINVVYQVECELCEEKYIGQTSRPAYYRLLEHLQAARDPLSHEEQPMAIHYEQEDHRGKEVLLKFSFLTRQSRSTIEKRKSDEEKHIIRRLPSINSNSSPSNSPRGSPKPAIRRNVSA